MLQMCNFLQGRPFQSRLMVDEIFTACKTVRPKKLNPVDPVDTVNCNIGNLRIFEVKSERVQ